MPNLSLSKIYYSLIDAAIIAKCTPAELLHFGSLGEINFAVVVPDELDLFPVDTFANRRGITIIKPEFLILKKSTCLQIECNGKTEQSDFMMGYLFESPTKLKALPPSYANPAFMKVLGCFWRTFYKDIPQKIEITPERLFIIALDLQNFLQEKNIYLDEQPRDPCQSLDSPIKDVEVVVDTGNIESHENEITPILEIGTNIEKCLFSQNTEVIPSLLQIPSQGNFIHKIDKRSNELTAVTAVAIKNAVDSNDFASVWNAFVNLAELKPPPAPLVGFILKEGVKYIKTNGEVRIISSKAFKQRLVDAKKRHGK